MGIMKTVMYYQSLKRAQFPAVKETLLYRIEQYLGIKYLRPQATFMHNQLGETLWVHFQKSV